VAGTLALLPRLAAQADLVVGVDGGGALCLQAGVAPDLVVGDFDSLSPDDLDRLRESGAPIRQFPAEKDASDLELAVREARARGATSITVTAASTGRLDHTLAAVGVLCSAAELVPHLVEPDHDMWVLSPRGRDSMVLSGAGATISLFAFGVPAVVSAKGVVWELDSAQLAPCSSLGLSNRIGSAGRARISVSEGVALLLAPRVSGKANAQGI
jgi:thiamine pyrophosphokinase